MIIFKFMKSPYFAPADLKFTLANFFFKLLAGSGASPRRRSGFYVLGLTARCEGLIAFAGCAPRSSRLSLRLRLRPS